MMPRDRFGFLSVRDAEDGLLTTAPIANTRPKASLYVNADGLSRGCPPRDRADRQVGSADPRLLRAGAAVVEQVGLARQSGLGGQRRHRAFRTRNFGVRLRFTGPHVAQVKFYAAYIE